MTDGSILSGVGLEEIKGFRTVAGRRKSGVFNYSRFCPKREVPGAFRVAGRRAIEDLRDWMEE